MIILESRSIKIRNKSTKYCDKIEFHGPIIRKKVIIFPDLGIPLSILLHLTNAYFFYLFIYFFLMSLIANALKASRSVQIHAIESSLLALGYVEYVPPYFNNVT